jgi:hypothetical protein
MSDYDVMTASVNREIVLVDELLTTLKRGSEFYQANMGRDPYLECSQRLAAHRAGLEYKLTEIEYAKNLPPPDLKSAYRFPE